ncbi:MAG: OmpW family outer membrane protein, partial [Sideroxyarcus sp.]|nr:OmpW family outer membrane protein [Sideroxyarcus sp.]
NVKANISDPAPGAIGTVGMYFDEDHKWAVEVPVMALPFDIEVYGAGSFQNAGKIITGKTLGFLIFGHYYFGHKNDKFRPSVSVTANYLIPYDLQATSELERWTGGRTRVSSKGSLGLGWLVGGKYAINDRWDLNLHVGQFKAKVENTLTTYDTFFNARPGPNRSPIFDYWPGVLGNNLRSLRATGILDGQLSGMTAYRNSDVANRVNGGANLGTFTRKQTQTLDPYVLMMTVGYNF